MLAGSNVVDSCVATSDFRVLLDGFQSLFADLQVVVVAGGFVKEVSGLDELGSKVILTPVDLEARKIFKIL